MLAQHKTSIVSTSHVYWVAGTHSNTQRHILACNTFCDRHAHQVSVRCLESIATCYCNTAGPGTILWQAKLAGQAAGHSVYCNFFQSRLVINKIINTLDPCICPGDWNKNNTSFCTFDELILNVTPQKHWGGGTAPPNLSLNCALWGLKKYCLFSISDRPYQNMCDPNLFYEFPRIFFFFFFMKSLRDELLAVVKVTEKTLRKGEGGGVRKNHSYPPIGWSDKK